MTTMFATRAARRRAVAFTALLAVSLILMAISSSPVVTEFQNAMGFALRPVQGAIHDVADTVAGAFSAIGEIDRLHTDNAALRRENERLTADNVRAQALEQENEQLTALLQLRNAFQYETAAAEVIARESSEVRRTVTLSKGSRRRDREGRRRDRRGRRARRPGHRRRAELRDRDPDQRPVLDGHRPDRDERARRATSSASSAAH